jgi:hypothetical protein
MNGVHVATNQLVATTAPGAQVVETGDFNGDGKTDLLVNTGLGFAVWDMNGVHIADSANIGGTLSAGPGGWHTADGWHLLT